MFYGELSFTRFRIQRQENTRVQTELRKIIQRETGRRKRWDIPIGQVIEHGQQVPTNDPETLGDLKKIIRRNGH